MLNFKSKNLLLDFLLSLYKSESFFILSKLPITSVEIIKIIDERKRVM